MYRHNHVLLHSRDVINRMRAPYPAALKVERFEYRAWAIDVVTYDFAEWAVYLFSPSVDGKRLYPFATILSALTESKRWIDERIDQTLKEPVEAPPKVRGTKRPLRKKKA